jgi:hypothetical protein
VSPKGSRRFVSVKSQAFVGREQTVSVMRGRVQAAGRVSCPLITKGSAATQSKPLILRVRFCRKQVVRGNVGGILHREDGAASYLFTRAPLPGQNSLGIVPLPFGTCNQTSKLLPQNAVGT